MAEARDVLLLEAGQTSMQVLRARLTKLGFRVAPAKSPEQAHTLLRIAGSAIGAALFPLDVAVMDLAGALDFLRHLAGGADLRFVAAGPRPGREERARLRKAGVSAALWEPHDLHTLRFQMNGILCGTTPGGQSRSHLRVPVDLRVGVRATFRSKETRAYSLSAGGAFLATGRPSQRGATVQCELALPVGTIRVPARVVMTNVPGNLQRRNLPLGMGVAFEKLTQEQESLLGRYAESRARDLAL
jgi:CheY-like chemotaxis protein